MLVFKKLVCVFGLLFYLKELSLKIDNIWGQGWEHFLEIFKIQVDEIIIP